MAQAIKKPVQPYSKLYNRELTKDEVAEIRHNLAGFFHTLIQLDRLQKQEEQRNDKQNKRSSDRPN